MQRWRRSIWNCRYGRFAASPMTMASGIARCRANKALEMIHSRAGESAITYHFGQGSKDSMRQQCRKAVVTLTEPQPSISVISCKRLITP